MAWFRALIANVRKGCKTTTPKRGKKESGVKRMMCWCVEGSPASIQGSDATGVAYSGPQSTRGSPRGVAATRGVAAELGHSTLERFCTLDGGNPTPKVSRNKAEQAMACTNEASPESTNIFYAHIVLMWFPAPRYECKQGNRGSGGADRESSEKESHRRILFAAVLETEGLEKDLEQTRNHNCSLEEEVIELEIQKEFLERKGQAKDARNRRLERELQRKEEDLEWAVHNRRCQQETLRLRQENSSQLNRALGVVTERTMPPGMERDIKTKCLRDDLWGLYAMNDSIVEQTQRQSEELGELRRRLFEDREKRGALEAELRDWTTKVDMEQQRGETLEKELQEVEQELKDYGQQLQRRDREKEDLRRWGKQDEIETARLQVETSVDSQFLSDVLLALHDMNSSMVAMEEQIATLTWNSEHHKIKRFLCLHTSHMSMSQVLKAMLYFLASQRKNQPEFTQKRGI
ncbi:hypothetical protein BSKO_09209 [Bryopsis sp. KO-2023]|nr:hypothetical protein BSKO_09209 [Bryopsis sp. KO-2023]